MRKRRLLPLVAVIILGTGALVHARPKTDIVALKNGDRLTCEIRQLSRGKLEVKTDSMDKVYIEWADIATLRSGFYFQVTDSRGRFCFGSLEIREGTNTLRVASDTTIVTIPMLAAVQITPIERTFWSRNKGSLSFGFNYAKSTDLAELYFDVSNRYRTQRNIVDTEMNTTVTDQGDTDGTKRRAALGAAYYHIFGRSVTASMGAKIERNDEINLRRRILARTGGGYNQIATNQNVLMLAAGLAVNDELYTTGDETWSLEAVFSGDYSVFQYNTPKTNVDLSLDVYPSLTEQGRYRLDILIDVRRELVADLFFDLEYYQNYDNKPPSDDESSNDYGIKTSLGYTW